MRDLRSPFRITSAVRRYLRLQDMEPGDGIAPSIPLYERARFLEHRAKLLLDLRTVLLGPFLGQSWLLCEQILALFY